MPLFRIFVGSYTDVISTLLFDPCTSELRLTRTSASGSNPSWVETHPRDKTLVLACNELSDGIISLFRSNEEGSLELLQTTSSGGKHPAHFLVTEDEVVVANYSSGTLLTVPLDVTKAVFGESAAPALKFDFSGSGPRADRQEASHPHQVIPNPFWNELLVPDLGGDKLWRLSKDESGKSWQVVGELPVKAGHGPRHAIVHDDMLYVLNELPLSLSQYRLSQHGSRTISHVSTFPTLTPPTQPAEGMLAAELLLTEASAAYPETLLYASNRNDPSPEGDSIAIFSSGEKFALINEVRTGLKHIRAMTLFGEDNKYLILGGKDGGGIKVYERVNGGRDLKQIAQLEGVEQPTVFAVL
ncbi:hypothetical protein FRC03_009960 [Tulasnella sp. 419]|nr:hypothetical protein FRC03_009960 [Tulasnella sp. 419]